MIEIDLGQIVKSTAGRDKDDFMIVIGFEGDDYVYLVNGKLRKCDNPKLKKIKHISKTNNISEEVSEKLNQKFKISNALIRKELEKYEETK